MAKTYNKMLIDVNSKISNIVTEVQGDQNSRYLDIYLFNNGIPIDLTGHTVRIYMRRTNTNPLEEFFNDGEITESARGRCQFLLSTQSLAKEGELEAQVSIWNGTEEILSTQVFKIMVTKKLRTNGSVESSNEYGALVVLFQNLYEAHDLMTTMVQNIGNPSDIAAQYNLATMWQAWEFLTDYMKTDLTNMIERAIANASVQGVLDKIGNAADTGGSVAAGTVMGKLNVLLSNLSVIKSIQRGTITMEQGGSGNKTISIGAINPNKTFVYLDGFSGSSGNSGSGRDSTYVTELTNNELTVYFTTHCTIGYEIIEFY